MKYLKLCDENVGKKVGIIKDYILVSSKILNMLKNIDASDFELIQNQKNVETIQNRFINFFNVFDNVNQKKEIHSTLLKKIFTNNYSKYIDYLYKNQIIKKVKINEYYFEPNKYSISYEYFNNVKNVDYIIILNYQKYNRKKRILLTDKKYNEKYEDTIKRITLDYNKAIKDEILYFKNEESFKKRIKLINNFENNERFIKIGEKRTRVYNSCVNLSKICKKHLKIDNKTFFEYDLKNSQYLFLYSLLKDTFKDYEDESFKKDVEDGTLYNHFIELTYKNKIWEDEVCIKTKNDAKIALMRNIVAFTKKDSKNLVVNKFKQLYLKTFEGIINIKKKMKLMHTLQKNEARIMHNIYLDDSYFIVHDAIFYTNQKSLDIIIDTLNNYFKKYNLSCN